MAQLGADVDALDALAASFEDAGSRLEFVINDIDGAVRAAWWVGVNSDGFRRYWSGAARINGVALAQRFSELAVSVRQQADQQRRASSVASFSGGSGGFGPAGPGGAQSAGSPSSDRHLDPVRLGLDSLGLADLITGSGGDLLDVLKSIRGIEGGLDLFANVSLRGNVAGGLFGGAISAGSIAYTGITHGVSSPEFLVASIDGSLSTAAGFVPFGGIAYEGGKLIGHGIYNFPAGNGNSLGDLSEMSHASFSHVQAADSHGIDFDLAMKRGDIEAASRALELQRIESERAMAQSSGAMGLLNSLNAVNPFRIFS